MHGASFLCGLVKPKFRVSNARTWEDKGSSCCLRSDNHFEGEQARWSAAAEVQSGDYNCLESLRRLRALLVRLPQTER